MKTRRWMEKVLVEAKEEQVELPWSRKLREERRAEKPQVLTAAE
ncbi:hypothetical protein [Jannaschia sp. CCS1]|nr:hypothetical protein [Jannaschia sp. CCS1]